MHLQGNNYKRKKKLLLKILKLFYYRPAIVVLLMSMVNEKQPFLLRCSVLYCFQCFLYKNEIGQAQLIQTLLPQGNEAPSLTTGLLNNIITNFIFY